MIEFYAKAKLPTRFGVFNIYVFKNEDKKKLQNSIKTYLKMFLII